MLGCYIRTRQDTCLIRQPRMCNRFGNRTRRGHTRGQYPPPGGEFSRPPRGVLVLVIFPGGEKLDAVFARPASVSRSRQVSALCVAPAACARRTELAPGDRDSFPFRESTVKLRTHASRHRALAVCLLTDISADYKTFLRLTRPRRVSLRYTLFKNRYPLLSGSGRTVVKHLSKGQTRSRQHLCNNDCNNSIS